METRTLIIFSDIHAGDQLGLCPQTGFKLDSGNMVYQNPIQKRFWEHWEYCWREWVPDVTRGDKDVTIIVNGDAIDGVHHNSSHQISHNLEDQKRCAYEILAPIRDKTESFYMIRGSSAHDGESGQCAESLADKLDAIPNEFGQYARHELWKSMCGDHALVHLLHHIGTTGSAAYESTAVHKEYIEACTESARWGLRAPDVIVRSHRHRFFKTEVANENDRGMSIVTPGWQGKTPFVFRIGMRQSHPQLGMVMLRVHEDGELYERHYVHALERPKVE